ncbi:hypothetical protein [Actinomadura madurae]|uniref:hypothetical protein n=1 Tax=Actinomadura madurae TaxID=1993 RepID=UPI0020D21BE0|nr:hypothetical protein [Actinomadura madurae]MCP9979049.1 hypothetical protein [Actinomadura madurae]MCQ0015232.1 hypothetical protein [Actinomadura madurae]
MVWLGLVLVVAGAVPALTASGDLAGVDLTVAGAIAMAAGAVLLVTGILRLRGRRRAARAARHRPTTGRPPARSSPWSSRSSTSSRRST